MNKSVSKWLLMITASIVAIQNIGLTFMFGSFLIALLDTYNSDRARTTTIQSLHVGFSVGFGVISGTLITRFGIHRVAIASSVLVPIGFVSSYFATSVNYLYISIGLIAGIGNSLGYISSIVAISRVFTDKQKFICLSIQSSAVAVASLGYPYLIDFLLSNYGLRGSFLILSAFQSNASSFTIWCIMNKDAISEPSKNRICTANNNTSLMTQKESNKAQQQIFTTTNSYNVSENVSGMTTDDSGNDANINKGVFTTKRKRQGDKINGFVNILTSAKSLMSNPSYVIILVTTGFTVGSLNAYLGLLLDICLWKGISYKQGLFQFVIFNITSAVTRLVPGILKQKTRISLFIFPIISAIVGCILGLLLLFGTGYIVLVSSSCLLGIAIGTVISSMTMIVVEIIPERLIPIATGLLFTTSGILSSVIGPIFGNIRDLTGSYSSVLLTISIIHAIASVFSITAALIYRHKNTGKSTVVAHIVVNSD